MPPSTAIVTDHHTGKLRAPLFFPIVCEIFNVSHTCGETFKTLADAILAHCPSQFVGTLSVGPARDFNP